MTMTNTYETTINHVTEGNDKDEYVVIETSEKTVISALEKKAEAFEVIRDDNIPGMPRLVRFRIPFDQVNWSGLAKQKRHVAPSSLANLRGGLSTGEPRKDRATEDALPAA